MKEEQKNSSEFKSIMVFKPISVIIAVVFLSVFVIVIIIIIITNIKRPIVAI